LDQSLSRARFNIDVSRIDAAELDVAIDTNALSNRVRQDDA
jgi:hypothetical protein